MCYVCNYACLHTTCEKIKMVLTDFQFPINIQINVTQSQKRAMTLIFLRIVGVKAHFTHCKQVRMRTFTDSSNVYNHTHKFLTKKWLSIFIMILTKGTIDGILGPH